MLIDLGDEIASTPQKLQSNHADGFQCNMAFEVKILRLILHAPASATKFVHNAVVRNGFANHSQILGQNLNDEESVAQIWHNTFELEEVLLVTREYNGLSEIFLLPLLAMKQTFIIL